MKTLAIDVHHSPLQVVLPVTPSGQLLEAAVSYRIDVAGHHQRRDVWWQASPEVRAELQQIIDRAIAETLVADAPAPQAPLGMGGLDGTAS